MAKLSLLIDDRDLKRLKQIALDRDAKFQEMVRSAVLGLLATPKEGADTRVKHPSIGPTSYSALKQRVVLLSELIAQFNIQLEAISGELLATLQALETKDAGPQISESDAAGPIAEADSAYEAGEALENDIQAPSGGAVHNIRPSRRVK